MKHAAFFSQLQTSLPKSSASDRRRYAEFIIEKDVELQQLAGLLEEGGRVSLRFQWLISELGMLDPERLHHELPFLFKYVQQLDDLNSRTEFATWWAIAGVPEENIGEAIDLLFLWLRSPETNVSIRARVLKVLEKLSKTYPELNPEIILNLEDHLSTQGEKAARATQEMLEQLRS